MMETMTMIIRMILNADCCFFSFMLMMQDDG